MNLKRIIVFMAIIISVLQLSGQEIELDGQVRIVNGTEGAGKILTSDANGLATWESPTSIPYPTNPFYLFLSELNAFEATNTSGFRKEWIKYPVLLADSNQVIVGGIDLTLKDNFNAWSKIEKIQPDRLGVQCNGAIDAFNFLVMEEGVHTIDGKMNSSWKSQ